MNAHFMPVHQFQISSSPMLQCRHTEYKMVDSEGRIVSPRLGKGESAANLIEKQWGETDSLG